MAEVEETQLPGVGVRHDFVTHEGDRVGVLSHRGGRRELLLYDRNDPDACRAVVRLDADDLRVLGELLGAAHVSEGVARMQQVEGITLDWVVLGEGSPYVGQALGNTALRTRTGVSVVAVVRDGTTIASPDVTFTFTSGDTVVVVGTPEGIGRASALLRGDDA